MIKNLLINYLMGNDKILEKLQIDLKLRPQNLNFDKYYQLAIEYENSKVNFSTCFLINSRS